MFLSDYEQPIPDKQLYSIAWDIASPGYDLEELVQEGRVAIWQEWQRVQWLRNEEPKGPGWYHRHAQRRMKEIAWKDVPKFGSPRVQGYSDAMGAKNRPVSLQKIQEDWESEDASVSLAWVRSLITETPFELLDRIPAVLVGLVG